jgi:signal transduction histidine kinase
MGLIPDNFYTRYFIQIGTLVQVITFALGLASRYNETRLQLAQEILSKERLALQNEIEKTELIEKQKNELEEQVQKQTIDLKVQNHTLEDIIEQLKDSELKLTQLNQLKDKLFSIISHDLRNPLATMQSTLKLITEHHTKLNEEEKKRLTKEAQASLDNLNQLLYNLLQWSRSQMNLLQYKSERIAIKPIFENCCKVVQLNAHMKNIKLHIVAQDHLYAHADKEMIEFAIRNLLSNAVKFSHRNSDVFLKASVVENKIKIQVLDSGIGMNQQTIQKLSILNATVTRRGTEKEKGTGLGLLISKDFIEKNGGHLHVQSEVNKGSAFSFELPLAIKKCLIVLPEHN